MMRLVAYSLGLALVLVAAGCQRGDDFLHHVVPEQPEVFNFTHKLKELQGETRVDILITIDNSGSMGTHQQNVITNSNLFIQEFTKNQKVLDWRMGLISTDTKENPYIGFDPGNFLDKSSPDPVASFNTAVAKLGTNGDATEKPWGSVQRVLMNYPAWVRKGAILAVVAITDAEEQSSIPARDFIQFLTQIKGNPQQIVAYGVYGPKEWNCQQSDSDWVYGGSVYEEFHKVIAGKTYQLCTPTFGANLADLGKDLVKRVKSPRIGLTMRPQIETIVVRWKDKILPPGPKADGGMWQYDFDLNAIVFHDLDFAPDENEEVVISYEEAVTARGK
jgi:hypothetical protein